MARPLCAARIQGYPDEDRGFEPIKIYEHARQSSEQRFGKKFNLDEESPMRGNTYDDGCFQNNPEILPQFEKHRMNLTALSQRFNLYFVAIRNQIYVYRPRNLAQAVPGEPDMVLRPPPLTGGAKPHSIYPDHPHCVNSLIVGDLGFAEILLLAFDDGDVYAFYTQDMDKFLRRQRYKPKLLQWADFRPLFKKNLADSAWGLAIHAKCRLIAISTNAGEQRLRIFDLKGSDSDYNISLKGANNIPMLDFFQYECGGLGRNILLAQDIEGRIYEVVFQQDYKISGLSNNIRAQQISGPSNVTVLPESEPSCIDCVRHGRTYMSWAITTLTPDCFMHTNSVQETFGNAYLWQRDHTSKIILVDTAKPVRTIEFRGLRVPRETYAECIETTTMRSNPHPRTVAILRTSVNNLSLLPFLASDADSPLPSVSTITFTPHIGDGISPPTARVSDPQYHIPWDCSMLRRTSFYHRQSMIVKIPELHLIAVGCTTGTVTLITPTMAMKDMQFGDILTHSAGHLSYRIEAYLPSLEQQQKGDRSRFGLVGIAASPIQGQENSRETQGAVRGGRIFRLLLHYYDHSILSYELSRRSAEVSVDV